MYYTERIIKITSIILILMTSIIYIGGKYNEYSKEKIEETSFFDKLVISIAGGDVTYDIEE